jgi:hypothetical protein
VQLGRKNFQAIAHFIMLELLLMPQFLTALGCSRGKSSPDLHLF